MDLWFIHVKGTLNTKGFKCLFMGLMVQLKILISYLKLSVNEEGI